MKLETNKCAVVHVFWARDIQTDDINVNTNCLRVLSETVIYWYLGMSQTFGMKEADVKQVVCEVLYGSLKNVRTSYLSGVNI